MTRKRTSASPLTRVSRLFSVWILGTLAAFTPHAAPAQEAVDPFSTQIMGEVSQSILVLNQERLLRSSLAGQALLREENAMKDGHRAEGLRLDEELEAEERDLTQKRDELPAEEFDTLAIAFDNKVVAVRRDHQEKSEALAEDLERLRQNFFGEIVPIVAQIMRERGASVVFDQRNVLFTGPDVDITQDVIDRLDAAKGLK